MRIIIGMLIGAVFTLFPFLGLVHADTTEGQRVETEILNEKDNSLAGRRYFTVEPGIQYSLISSNRLDISGYTIPGLPGFNIGQFNVEEVRKQIIAPYMTVRFGVVDLFQLDLRVPYIMREDEYTRGAGDQWIVRDVQGDDIGDIEGTALWTAMKEKAGWPGISVGLKVKSRTGKDPYGIRYATVEQINPDPNDQGNRTITTDLPLDVPTGSGHWAFTPFVTVAKTVDPAVLFASVQYFYHLEDKVNFTIKDGDNFVRVRADVDPSDYIGYSIGLAYALNDRLAMSTSFDQKFYTEAEVDGDSLEETDIILGSLVLGGTYAITDNLSFNLSLGIGLTPDSPDMEVSMRLPYRFNF